jgi:hypothetical protein
MLGGSRRYQVSNYLTRLASLSLLLIAATRADARASVVADVLQTRLDLRDALEQSGYFKPPFTGTMSVAIRRPSIVKNGMAGFKNKLTKSHQSPVEEICIIQRASSVIASPTTRGQEAGHPGVGAKENQVTASPGPVYIGGLLPLMCSIFGGNLPSFHQSGWGS